MRIAGIVAEYNPFHSGHAWQIATLRRMGFDAVVCVCSPSVVQRGEAALFPTGVRTKAALTGGADVVLSLPAPYACASAEAFAAAAVWLIAALGCVDTLAFGAESAGELLLLEQTAAALQSEALRHALRAALDAGLPLAVARAKAAEQICPGSGRVLTSPNDILAVEYCKALARLRAQGIARVPRPLALPRMGAGHDAPLAADEHAASGNAPQCAQALCGGESAEAAGRQAEARPGVEELSEAQSDAARNAISVCDGFLAPAIAGGRHWPAEQQACHSPVAAAPAFASATALRARVQQHGVQSAAAFVPAECLTLYKAAEAEGEILDPAAFSAVVLSRLRTQSPRELAAVRGTREGLENRLYQAVRACGTWDDLIATMKTKRYPTARLRRYALDAALGYTDALPARPPYLHVLGATQTGRAVLQCAKDAALVPMGHSLARLEGTGPAALAVARAHAAAEDMTALCLRVPRGCGAAYTEKYKSM